MLNNKYSAGQVSYLTNVRVFHKILSFDILSISSELLNTFDCNMHFISHGMFASLISWRGIRVLDFISALLGQNSSNRLEDANVLRPPDSQAQFPDHTKCNNEKSVLSISPYFRLLVDRKRSQLKGRHELIRLQLLFRFIAENPMIYKTFCRCFHFCSLFVLKRVESSFIVHSASAMRRWFQLCVQNERSIINQMGVGCAVYRYSRNEKQWAKRRPPREIFYMFVFRETNQVQSLCLRYNW